MRVAGYARVSTQEQKLHGVSIAAQEAALSEWAQQHGHRYLGAYNDAGISARSRYTKRPELLRLLEDVRAGRVDLIIFTKLDRWFRNVGDYYEIQRVLDDCGVAWKAIWEDYETETASGRLKVNIMLSVAQDEADRTSERIRQTNEYRWAAGEVVQKLPAGYRREGKRVVYDEALKPAVTAFFRTYLDTASVAQSIEAANLLGLRVSREGASKMLRNRFFTGTVRGIAVPAYLTEAEFELIQQRKSLYRRATKRKRVYLFSGLLVCANCGARMDAQATGNTRYYVCGGWLNRSKCSLEKRGYANERSLEGWLLEHLEGLREEHLRIARIREAETDDRPDPEGLRQRLERIKTLFIAGDIELAEYHRRKEEIEAQLRRATAVQRVDTARLRGLLPPGWREIYAGLSQEGKSAFWHRTLRQIRLTPGKDPEVQFLV